MRPWCHRPQRWRGILRCVQRPRDDPTIHCILPLLQGESFQVMITKHGHRDHERGDAKGPNTSGVAKISDRPKVVDQENEISGYFMLWRDEQNREEFCRHRLTDARGRRGPILFSIGRRILHIYIIECPKGLVGGSHTVAHLRSRRGLRMGPTVYVGRPERMVDDGHDANACHWP